MMEAFLGTIIIWPLPWAPSGWRFCDGSNLPVNQYQALYSLIGNIYGGTSGQNFNLPDLRGRVVAGIGQATQGASLNIPTLGNVVGAATLNTNLPLTGTVNGTITSGNATGSVTLNANQIPAHTHSINQQTVTVKIPANTGTAGNTNIPGSGTVLGQGLAQAGAFSGTAKVYASAPGDTNLAPFDLTVPASTSGNTGSGASVPLSLSVTGNTSTNLAGGIASINVQNAQPTIGLNFIICVDDGLYPPRP